MAEEAPTAWLEVKEEEQKAEVPMSLSRTNPHDQKISYEALLLKGFITSQ
jgi:hypothetical protein